MRLRCAGTRLVVTAKSVWNLPVSVAGFTGPAPGYSSTPVPASCATFKKIQLRGSREEEDANSDLAGTLRVQPCSPFFIFIHSDLGIEMIKILVLHSACQAVLRDCDSTGVRLAPIPAQIFEARILSCTANPRPARPRACRPRLPPARGPALWPHSLDRRPRAESGVTSGAAPARGGRLGVGQRRGAGSQVSAARPRAADGGNKDGSAHH